MRSLTPFTKTPLTNTLQVQGAVTPLSDSRLLVEFKISGATDAIKWPESSSSERREDGLWKHTCLEVFLGNGATPESAYLEINCAPNGHWNAYSFSSYRKDMAPAADTRVRLQPRNSEDAEARFQIEIDSRKPLEFTCLGLTAVIEFVDGTLSYWSLFHPGPQADFHNKAGWTALSTH
ncbi:DOMON-like domain-containing protein [Bdellovibrio bacteriovorus]|uniref:DOMON-like domain-containing protein n=1 Tax=Bdellovibrio bacteriovorus TaxID=959 RepID=A0A1Z3N750_BDEBC|nr:DOMON-like domain-containing protein [Bdellovibrio bacteriovorus]ASD63294.1 hypothetical protein B9G79_06775 [Bdellovibrio bacteriovorus]